MATTAKPPKPFQQKQRVEFTRRNGEVVRGTTVTGEVPKSKGSFVTVNIGSAKLPQLVSVRPSQLKRV
jgi:hypothetical protein